MKLRNEFVVAAPLERTWETLLDVPRVASALPGAAIEPGHVAAPVCSTTTSTPLRPVSRLTSFGQSSRL